MDAPPLWVQIEVPEHFARYLCKCHAFKLVPVLGGVGAAELWVETLFSISVHVPTASAVSSGQKLPFSCIKKNVAANASGLESWEHDAATAAGGLALWKPVPCFRGRDRYGLSFRGPKAEFCVRWLSGHGKRPT